MIRCKFVVGSTGQTVHGDSLEAMPVYSDEVGSENKAFWDYTPTGQLKLDCVKGDALKELKPGKEFYLDITPIEPDSE